MSPVWIAALCVVAVSFFMWGWARATRFRSEHGRSPWGISPIGWGVIHVVLLPIAWILFFGARRSTRVGDSSLTHVPDAVYGDTSDERLAELSIVHQLALVPPPQPAGRGWHLDPMHQAAYRFFDGQHWSREVSDAPAVEPAADAARPAADAHHPPPEP